MARVVITAGLAVAGTTQAHASVWTAQEQGSVSTGYDDNVRMTVANASSTSYANLAATAHLALEGSAWSWSVDPRATLTRYQHFAVLNRDEGYLDTLLRLQSETSTSSFALNWTDDTTLTSERGSSTLGQTNKRHQATALTMSHTQQWTERLDTQSQLYVTTNHYMQAANTGLLNYNYGSAVLAMNYALTTRSQFSLNSSIGKLQVPGIAAYRKTNQSVMLSYSTSFAERWQASFAAGPSQVRSEFSQESGTVYNVNVSRKSEISTLQLTYARDITPSGQGVLTRRQQLSLSASRALSERMNISITGSEIKNDSLLLSNNFNFYGVHYNEISASFSWRWTPTWTLAVNAGHAAQRLENSQQSALRNYASLRLSWSGLSHVAH